MKFKGMIFDLDGTLLDTIDDLSDSMNAVLANLGFTGHTVPDYKRFVGDGLKKLVIRSLPDGASESLILRAQKMMKREYYFRCLKKTRPYREIPEALEILTSHGVKLAVFSNKPDALTKKLIKHLLPGKYFEIVAGQKRGVPLKPDPAGALNMSALLGIAPKEILYLGDSSVDMMTAKAAGMFGAGALWGFRTREELLESGAGELFGSPCEAAVYVCDNTNGGFK